MNGIKVHINGNNYNSAKFTPERLTRCKILHYYKIGGANVDDLKSLRHVKKLTQQQVADLIGISLRSYKSYENDTKKKDTLKYDYIKQKLEKINPIDENHGIIEVTYIIENCGKVFDNYDVDFCYLFGSYAKNNPSPTSDVDLLISTNISGLKFYGLVEELRSLLHKKVDVLDVKQLKDNLELTQEILKDGIKIYG